MIYSLQGIIVDVTPETVAIDLGQIAYEVFVPRPQEFTLGQNAKLYVEEILTQDDHYLSGFQTKMEKDAFVSLLRVKGIGPKTALSALSGTTPEELFKAIAQSDAKFLKKLPGIGPKAASQIILDLQGKLVESEPKKDEREFPIIRATLKQLGFKKAEIDGALSTLPEGAKDDNDSLRLALRSLRKEMK
ncbi:MAG: Holliday junction branch migration protein RuvA [Bacilli bacterium]|nr:Holliday junction branch migration protein RuvA [Bacilli bacterium]